MANKRIQIGNTPLLTNQSRVEGGFINFQGERFYKISHYNRMRPFFISLVSPYDHWLFISSTGGLSAGRRNEESALFPYYTDDKISDSSEQTGSKTIIKLIKGDIESLWEPFSIRTQFAYHTERNIYKNRTGNKLIFEEINHDLELTFRYGWMFSDRFGIIKKSEIVNKGSSTAQVQLLDGLQNILPYGISSDLQNRRSNLANAYKRSETIAGSSIGVFALSSMIVDKAEPSEALKSTTVWSIGESPQNILLSNLQLDTFRSGMPIHPEQDVKAEPGCYFIQLDLSLSPDSTSQWYFACEVNQDLTNVNDLTRLVKTDQKALLSDLERDIEKGTGSLRCLVGMADGLQISDDELSITRHYANVLFNIMRGGVFEDQYTVDKEDFIKYVSHMSYELAKSDFFDRLEDQISYSALIEKARKSGDPDIIRLSYEYLPLTFSRRHGDPSRPWNRFSIETTDEAGHKIRTYAGNWRDIFQNWEALALSFPNFILSMITKFVNASTIDGYNPYRITREGIDWEVIEPDDPWSYIGYWGDHQIIYLQKLLEIARSHHTSALQDLLTEEHFVYANVPYRIADYERIKTKPQDTIDFDHNLEDKIGELTSKYGADGKFIMDESGTLLKCSLAEKLLVTLLAKLSNFVPEGGIWLNTQRPEWNDANNALVGNGVSMVTLCYIRRFVAFLNELMSHHESYPVHSPVAELLDGIHSTLKANQDLLKMGISNRSRKQIVDRLGILGEAYRRKAYETFDESTISIPSKELKDFLSLTLEYIDHTIRVNRREDGLYHAYNLIGFHGEELKIDHLYEMLEGQVAVLSAGVLNLEEALSVLDSLKASAIYRADQYSYMLYPNRELAKFAERNKIPKNFADNSELARELLKRGDRSLITKDEHGDYHFNGEFNNADSLKAALGNLRLQYADLVEKERTSYLEVFEEMFDHKAFTGRSGTFFGYEGLGSIYWHMVSKLLLAVQENIFGGKEKYEGTAIMGRMIDHYYEIRAGIGINKSPELYGSFPTDPYSHTPGHKGAQQPGMTGQVKEDVMNRWAELGIRIQEGKISFQPYFLHDDEYLAEPNTFEYFDIHGGSKKIEVEAGELAFSYCQIPVIYKKGKSKMEITYASGETKTTDAPILSMEDSQEIFQRTGKIMRIDVAH